jgi:hypothetical protein
MCTFDVTSILDNHIISHDEIGLAVSIVRILVIIVVIVIANQTRVGLSGVGAEIYRRVDQVMTTFRLDG